MKQKIDVSVVEPFLKGTVEVLKVQCQTEAKPGAPFLKEAKSPIGGDISGIIGLTSDVFNGTVIITFPEKTFLKLMSRMLGEEFTELTPDIHDGATELSNIIFGHAKRVLSERGHKVKMAIPSLITGKNHSISNTQASTRVAIPFESDAGTFGIEVVLNHEEA